MHEHQETKLHHKSSLLVMVHTWIRQLFDKPVRVHTRLRHQYAPVVVVYKDKYTSHHYQPLDPRISMALPRRSDQKPNILLSPHPFTLLLPQLVARPQDDVSLAGADVSWRGPGDARRRIEAGTPSKVGGRGCTRNSKPENLSSCQKAHLAPVVQLWAVGRSDRTGGSGLARRNFSTRTKECATCA